MSIRQILVRSLAGIAATLSVLLGTASALGDPAALTRRRVAELVKAAPAARVARSEASVSGAAVTAAGSVSSDNPVVSGMGGMRWNPDGTRPFSGVATLSWPVDVGGKRGARVAAAKAEYRSASASAASEERRVLLAALLQHALVLRDQRQLSITVARHALSKRLYATAQKRHAAGGVPHLDVALAAMQEKRDASANASAKGTRDANKLELLTLLGLPDDPPVEGSLVPEGEVPTLTALSRRAKLLPDVRAAAAELHAAQTRAARERATPSPTINLLAQYERDDRANIGLIGLAVPIPILNANRAEVATSASQVHASRARMAERWIGAKGQLKGLHARYLSTKAAVDALAPTAGLAAQAANLATRGYELGENDLSSVLLVRREAIDVEAALLEAFHAHAVVKLELLVMAGRTPQ